MKKYFIIIFLVFFLPFCAKAGSLSQDLSGRILLDVERNGEAWYIYPEDNKRYYLGRPDDAFQIMRELGLGINEVDFNKIALPEEPAYGDDELARKLSGKIVLEVEKNGEAWYIYPKDLRKYYLGRPDDAFQIMRELGLGITRDNLARIHKPGLEESIDKYSSYEHKKISIKRGEFSIELVEIDLSNPNLEIITDTTEPYPNPDLSKETGDHGAKSLGDFVFENDGFAGINGTYFCSSSGCGAQNYYFYPVYRTKDNVLVNLSELKYWTTGPIIAFDENNKFYYFKDSREFPYQDWYRAKETDVVAAFEKEYGVKLQAAIGNKPRFLDDYTIFLIDWELDAKQRDAKLIRNALGYKDNKIYLVVAYNADIMDLGYIMKALGVEYAINLDGGNSSALYYNDEYMIGPGRDVPNAIIFREKNNLTNFK